MQILPFLFAAGANANAQSALAGETNTNGSSSFADLLGGMTNAAKRGAISLYSGSQNGGEADLGDSGANADASGKNGDVTLTLLRKAFKKLGLNGDDAATMASGLDLLPADKRTDILGLARIAAGEEGAAGIRLSDQNAQVLVGVLQKLGFQGEAAWNMTAAVESGRGQDVWRQVKQRVNALPKSERVTVTPNDLLSLRHALDLTPRAQARVGEALAGGGKAALSAQDIKKMLSLMESESLQDDQSLQDKVNSMKQIIQDGLREARERQQIERNADARQDKQTLQARLKIEHAVKERGDNDDKIDFTPGRDMAKVEETTQNGRRLPDLRNAAQAAQAASDPHVDGNTDPKVNTVKTDTSKIDTLKAGPGQTAEASDAKGSAKAQSISVAMRATETAAAAANDAHQAKTEAAAAMTRTQTAMEVAAATAASKATQQTDVDAKAVPHAPAADAGAPAQRNENAPASVQVRDAMNAATGQRNGGSELPKGQTPDAGERAEKVETPSNTAASAARDRELRLERLTGRDAAGKEQDGDHPGRQADSTFMNAKAGSEQSARAGSDVFSSVLTKNDHMSDVAKAALQAERPHAVSEQVLKQIENGALRNLGQGTRQLTMRLDPPTLGKVSVILTVVNKEVKAVLKAENNDAGRIINDNLHQIRASLEAQGLRVEKLEVQTQAQNDPNNRDSQWQNANEHNHAREQRENAQDSGLRRRFFSTRPEPDAEVARHVQDVTPEESFSNNRINVIA